MIDKGSKHTVTSTTKTNQRGTYKKLGAIQLQPSKEYFYQHHDEDIKVCYIGPQCRYKYSTDHVFLAVDSLGVFALNNSSNIKPV